MPKTYSGHRRRQSGTLLMRTCARAAWELIYELSKMASQDKRTQRYRLEKGFFKTAEDGSHLKWKTIRIKRLWVVRLSINRRETRCKNKQSNVNETVSDGCLAMGEGITEKISHFQVRIESTISIPLIGDCDH